MIRRFAVLVIFASACASPPTAASDPNAIDILFIGNSLTYYNDLPLMVEALADSAGESVDAASVTFANFALIDHWNAGEALDSIDVGGWEFVVLQQGPSSLQVNRDSLRLLASWFDQRVAQIGGTTALYSVWPTSDRQQDFTRAIESYTLAASDVSGVMLPVASAWLAAWQIDNSLALYDPDGLHPSEEGSYLAALVICSRLLEISPGSLPSRFRLRNGNLIQIDESVVNKLRQAAIAATSG